MNAECIICTDQMGPAGEIFVTRCGHLFHHECLAEWIVGESSTCPQCRQELSPQCYFRVYPAVDDAGGAGDAGDPGGAARTEDSLLKACMDTAQTLLNQQKALHRMGDKKFIDLSAKLRQNDELLKEYQQKVQQLEQRNNEIDAVVTENRRLHEQVQDLNGSLALVKDTLLEKKITNTSLLNQMKVQNEDIEKLKEENRSLKDTAEALRRSLNGVQVSSAPAEDCSEAARSGNESTSSQPTGWPQPPKFDTPRPSPPETPSSPSQPPPGPREETCCYHDTHIACSEN